MKKVLKKRTGFTLVELLIVIIIIGILAGAMLLVAGSGTDKAEATKIVSDLRGLKAAALMYYADKGSNPVLPTVSDLENYMDREISADLFEVVSDEVNQWWVGRKGVADNSGIAKKLSDMATSAGLFANPASGDVYSGTGTIYMRAR